MSTTKRVTPATTPAGPATPDGGSEVRTAAGSASSSPREAARTRMTPEDRRRQFVGIGLRMLVDRPGEPLSLDAVAIEAGVSRGLLFHYFPTRDDFQDAVIAAGGRRVLRNLTPDDGVAGEAALAMVVERFIAQIHRRREFYAALMLGRGRLPSRAAGEAAMTLRQGLTDLVVEVAGLGSQEKRAVVHGWIAYAEDRALELGPDAPPDHVETLARHCLTALRALLTLPHS